MGWQTDIFLWEMVYALFRRFVFGFFYIIVGYCCCLYWLKLGELSAGDDSAHKCIV